jgi:Raf kinase inhibitor-like YbhB/YbcL family protein
LRGAPLIGGHRATGRGAWRAGMDGRRLAALWLLILGCGCGGGGSGGGAGGGSGSGEPRGTPSPPKESEVAGTSAQDSGARDSQASGPFTLSSSAFAEGATIPRQHTADGEDLSPPLRWTGAPAGTQSFALLCDDPDAPRGTWVHWVAYDIEPAVSSLGTGIPATPAIGGGGARQGKNDFGKLGYGGPSPPPGPAHRYYFRLLALDKKLGLEPGATMKQVLAAAEGHALGRTELMGRYGR